MNQQCSPTSSEEQWRQSYYKCDKCRDTGWLLIHQKKAAPLAVSCHCRELQKLKAQWSSAGLNSEDNSYTFNNFVVWNEAAKKAKNTAAAYYKDFTEIASGRNNSILFSGQVGSGKTHLSVALALNFMKKNVRVVYMPYRDVITKVKQSMLDDEYYRKTISKFQTCEVLLIDDLFKGKISESDINIIFEIINYRYLNRLPLIVSTEFTVDHLLSIDEAIGSRIYEMCRNYVVEIEKSRDNNYRLK
jgi:DNA replication protein DnaC